MKQNIISQILQVLANDKSINNPGLQQQIDKIKVDNPMANVVDKANPLDKPNPMANSLEGPKNNIVNVPNAPVIDKPSIDKPIKQPLENPIKQPVINKPIIDEIVKLI